MMEIHKLRKEDIDDIVCIEKENFSQAWSHKAFEDVVDRDDVLFLVSEEEGKITGYAGVYISLDEGEITNVAVSASYRRRGIGEKIIDEMTRILEEKGVNSIFLEVRCSNNPAISLYKKKGFREVGVRKGFYDKPKEDAFIMLRQKE